MSNLYEEAKRLIPGGTSLFSKRPELYSPDHWPYAFERARGINVCDTDGNSYEDWGHFNVGANILGYADDDVDRAVIKAISRGQSCSLNCPEEVELTRMLLSLHPWAEMAKYTRSGGEAIAVAIRIAQAKTGKKGVMWNPDAYHGWHVNNPLTHEGYAPQGEIAAIIVEMCKYREVDEDYLESIRKYAKAHNAVLILDEISTGFRFTLGGLHLLHEFRPDIVVFSKAIANGYPLGVVLGTRDVMKAAENTFISSTTWSERIGFAAGIATVQKLWAEDIYEHLYYIGNSVKITLEMCGFKTMGHPAMLHADFGSKELYTHFVERMLERGYLTGRSFNPSLAHRAEAMFKYLQVIREVSKLPIEVGNTAMAGIPRLT